MTKTITNKQEEIITLLYKYRFLNRLQIQKFLKHKYHKRINDWLNDLTKKEYINRIYSTNFGENTKPAKYYLGLNSIRYLKQFDGYPIEVLRKFYHEKDRSESFIDQCMLCGDIILTLQEAADKKKGQEFELSYFVATSTDLANPGYAFNFLYELNVDLLVKKVSKKQGRKKDKIQFFIFSIISPTLPRYSIRKRIKDFIECYNGYDWDTTKPDDQFPNLMIILPNIATLIYAKRLVRRLFEDEDKPEDLIFSFTTTDKIKKNTAVGDIWE